METNKIFKRLIVHIYSTEVSCFLSTVFYLRMYNIIVTSWGSIPPAEMSKNLGEEEAQQDWEWFCFRIVLWSGSQRQRGTEETSTSFKLSKIIHQNLWLCQMDQTIFALWVFCEAGISKQRYKIYYYITIIIILEKRKKTIYRSYLIQY